MVDTNYDSAEDYATFLLSHCRPQRSAPFTRKRVLIPAILIKKNLAQAMLTHENRYRKGRRDVPVELVRGDAPVRVVLCMFKRLLLALGEIEVLGLVRQPERLEHERDLPTCAGLRN